jgi:hypothetical protein
MQGETIDGVEPYGIGGGSVSLALGDYRSGVRLLSDLDVRRSIVARAGVELAQLPMAAEE